MPSRSAQAIPSALHAVPPGDALLVSRVLAVVAALGLGFGAVHGIAAAALGDPAVAALAALHLTLVLFAVVGRSLIRAGRGEQSIDAIVAGILVTSIAWTLVMPGLESVSALGPLLAIAYALPLRSGRPLARIVLAAMATSVAVVALDSVVAPATDSPYIVALNAPTLAAGTVLIALALWRFGLRMRTIGEAASSASELLRIRDRAIAATTSGVIILDVREPGWRIASVNPAFERITGYTAEEVIGTDGLQVVGPGTDQEALARHRATIAAGESGTETILNYRPDGTTYWNELSVAPIVDDAGTISHYVVIQTDVTSAITLDEQLRQAQRMETVGQLAGGVAHDFNNILTAIGGYARMAEDELATIAAGTGADAAGEGADPAATAAAILDYVGEISLATDRAAALTRQLLAFGRREVVEPEIVTVETVVTGVLPMLRRLTGEQHVIESTFAPGLPPVLVDPIQLEQVLINLVVNARDASPDGARIRIETSLAASATEEFVRVSVTDNGSGIEPAVQARMFEPFFTTKPRGHGTGLGLATVYGIVSAAGGTIRCTSTVGVGTTFTVELPAVPESARALPDAAPRGHVSLTEGCETVLLVEDEDAVRVLAATILRRAGYCVLEAADGATALAIAEDGPARIDILVSDVVMPGINGTELAARLTTRSTLPVVLMSGYPDGALELVVGPRPRFLQKPFEPGALLAAVREELDRGRGGAPGGPASVALGPAGADPARA